MLRGEDARGEAAGRRADENDGAVKAAPLDQP